MPVKSNTTESNPTEVVDAVLTYRRARYNLKLAELRVRAVFPSLSDGDLDLVSSAIENAASASLTQAIGLKGRAKKKAERVLDKRAKRPPLPEALLSVIGSDTLHFKEAAERLKEKGWLPRSKSPLPYIGQVLSTNPKLFTRVKSKGRGYYCVRRAKAKGKAKTARRNRKSYAKHVDNNKVLSVLIQHGKPFTSPEIAKKLGLTNAKPLAPLFVSLRDNGALKKHENADGVLWEPVAAKLREYQTEHVPG